MKTLTLKEATKYLRIGESTLRRRAIEAGGYRIGSAWRFDVSDLEKFKAEQKLKAKQQLNNIKDKACLDSNASIKIKAPKYTTSSVSTRERKLKKALGK